MNIFDLFIVLFLILGALIGFKQGFTKSLFDCVGYIVIIILSFILKNPISQFLMLHLPFFDFYGVIKGISVLNIAVYEIISFSLVFTILTVVFKILILLTSIFEKILSMTIVLGIPSKILGMIIGIIKNYLIAFVILFILSLPNFADNDIIKKSKLKDPILEKTPILNTFAFSSLSVFNEFSGVKEKYQNTKDSNKFNYETLELFLKYKIIDIQTTKKLIEKDKLHIKNSDVLIEKYGD